MYYLSRAGVPVPAEAPYAAHLNERKEWSYHKKKHEEALKNVTGLVDRRPPKCIDPPVQSIQAKTRQFTVDAKNAEIGRENRKLCDKLSSIARTSGPCAPPGYAGRAVPRAPVPAGMATGSETRSRSLNASGKRVEQRRVDLENASMVRRILTTKSSFDPIRDERSYQRHKRNATMLQRLPGKPRSLPPLRSRPNSHPATLRGLEGLLAPGDLQRSMSDGTRKALTCDIPLIPHSSTAPPATFQDPESDDVFSEEDQKERPAVAEEEAPQFATTSPLPMTSEPALPGKKPVTPKDSPPMRREWLAPSSEEEPQAADHKGALGIQGGSSSTGQTTGQAGLLGCSSVSDLQYADDWDENSFTSSGYTSANPSREPSTTLSREPSRTSLNRGVSGSTMNSTGTGVGLGTTQQQPVSALSPVSSSTPSSKPSSPGGQRLSSSLVKPDPPGMRSEKPEPFGLRNEKPDSLGLHNDKPDPLGLHNEKPDPLGLRSEKPFSLGTNSDKPDPLGLRSEKADPLGMANEKPDHLGLRSEKPDSLGLHNDKPDPLGLRSERPDPLGLRSEKPDPLGLHSEKSDPLGLRSENSEKPDPLGLRSEKPDPLGLRSENSDPLGLRSEKPDPLGLHSEKSDPLGLHSGPRPAPRQDSFEADLFANLGDTTGEPSHTNPQPKAGRRRRPLGEM